MHVNDQKLQRKQGWEKSNMSEDFETQIIGRIRRMPQQMHYNNELLDNCYLYTFDEKYEEIIGSMYNK